MGNSCLSQLSMRRNSELHELRVKAVSPLSEETDHAYLWKFSSPGTLRRKASSFGDAGLRKVFDQIAIDHCMTLQEFQKACLEALQLDLNSAELERVFNYVDHNHAGWVSYEQFVYGVRRSPLLKNIISTFKVDASFTVPAGYDFTKSTNDNYGVSTTEGFYGNYADIRETLDYSYHTNYTKQRQAWQDAAVNAVVCRTAAQSRPWIVYTAGAMGAGKGYCLSWLSSNDIFPLENIVHIDPDHFKSMMPEWKQYVSRDQEEAGTLCHRETGFLQEIAQETALRRRQNIWVDGSLKDGKWFTHVFQDIRKRFPLFRIAIFHVFGDETLIRKRVKLRAMETGRSVPEEQLAASLEATERAVTMLLPYVDFVARIRNTETEPVLEAVEEVRRHPAWSVIQSRFARTEASDGEFPRALSPLRLEKTALKDTDFSLDYKTRVALTDSKRRVLQCVSVAPLPDGQAYSLWVSPVSPVNLDSDARAAANIPSTAHSFAWCHGSTRLCQSLHDQSMKSLLCHGGYFYFDVEHTIVQVNAVVHMQTQSLVQFGVAHELPEETCRKLKHRFRPVTLEFQTAKGAESAAWVLPGETIGTTAFGGYGGFAFTFSEQSGVKNRYFPVMSVSP
eukprot:m.167766 g.167766  ORF g.167766 m.167766 type:complete len:619 (+) comp17776_c0_seq5:285-2141(+)